MQSLGWIMQGCSLLLPRLFDVRTRRLNHKIIRGRLQSRFLTTLILHK